MHKFICICEPSSVVSSKSTSRRYRKTDRNNAQRPIHTNKLMNTIGALYFRCVFGAHAELLQQHYAKHLGYESLAFGEWGKKNVVYKKKNNVTATNPIESCLLVCFNLACVPRLRGRLGRRAAVSDERSVRDGHRARHYALYNLGVAADLALRCLCVAQRQKVHQ